MDKTEDCGSSDEGSIPSGRTSTRCARKNLYCLRQVWRSVPNGKAPVSKTGVRKDLQVQILSPPHKRL